MDIIGVLKVWVSDLQNFSKKYLLNLVIMNSDHDFTPLLGRSWLDCLYPSWRNYFNINEINVVENELLALREKFPKVFVNKSSEPIKGYTAEIHLIENVKRIFFKSYTVPFGIRAKLNVN